MTEDITNEPPRERSPLEANKTLARQILKTLGQESLGNYELFLRIQHEIVEPIRRAFSNIPHSQMPNRSPIHSIPDKIEAGKLLQTAWIGTPAQRGEGADIVDFRLHKPGATITRSTKTENRDKHGRETVTYAANTQGTERLIEQLIVDLGFEDQQQTRTIDETMRDLRRANEVTLTSWKTPDLQMTVTRPANIRPEVAQPIAAAYRVRIRRVAPSPTTSS